MESSAAFDGAVFGEEETITVEIVQEAVETTNDDGQLIILQPLDSEAANSEAVELQESVETDDVPFENIDIVHAIGDEHGQVIEQQEQQFMEIPLPISSSQADETTENRPQFVEVPLPVASSADEIIQQEDGVHQIVSFSDHQQLVQSLQGVPSSGLTGQEIEESNIIILQPIGEDGQSVVTSVGSEFIGNEQTYTVPAITDEVEQQTIEGAGEIVEIPNEELHYMQETEEIEGAPNQPVQYIRLQGPGDGDSAQVQYIRIQQPRSGDNAQIQYVQVADPENNEVTQQLEQAEYIQSVEPQQGFIKIGGDGDSENKGEPQYIELQPIQQVDTTAESNQSVEPADPHEILQSEAQEILQSEAQEILPADIEELKPNEPVKNSQQTQIIQVSTAQGVKLLPVSQIPEFPDSQADEDDDYNDDDLQPQETSQIIDISPQNTLNPGIIPNLQSVKVEPKQHIIEVFKSYDAVLARISEIEIDTNSKFVREKKNSKIFGQEWIKRPVRNEREFAWCSKNTTAGGERERLSPDIEFDGIPFINVGYIRLDCNLGSQDVRQVKKLVQERKRKFYASKKIGCTAKIYVSQVTKFPDYMITEDTKRNRQMLLQQLTVDLKYDWENVRTESWYYCRFPGEEDHSGHPLRGEGAGLHLPMDHRIKEKVKEWTLQGINSCSQMKALIEQYVTEHLLPGQLIPQTRRFYPRTKEICNVMYCAKVQQLPPQLDLEKIDTVVKENLTGINPGDSIHYRPSYPKGHHFMFVYQSEWQKHLLLHYGKELVFVEPIFKHSQYPLPIFCLVVRTNTGFSVAGMFSLKLVTKPLLAEVFRHLTEWNPDWKPRHLIADFSDENIAGILENFTDLTVLLTEGYMEETWRKWIDRKDSGVAKDTENLISMLKAVARAQTQTEFEVALEAFVNSPRYLSVVRVRRWFLAKWLPVCERWADVYKDDALRLITHGNRGKERKADLIAYICSCLDSMREAPLSKVFRYMVTVIMPELFAEYSRSNVQMLSDKASRDDAPAYLKSRPSEFINHIMDRSDPCAFDEGVNIQELGMGSFKVNTHDVDFTRPYCSCTDWQKHSLPCKHFCVIFNHMPGWGWESLVESYRDSPLFVGDPFCVEANKKMQERTEIKFEAIEQEDLNEVEPSNIGDDDLDDALSMLPEDSQESEMQIDEGEEEEEQSGESSDKLELAKTIQTQFQDLTKAVKERKDSAGLLRMINDKLNSVLNVLKSPTKATPSRSKTQSPRTGSVAQSPARQSDTLSETSSPIVYHIKTDKEDRTEKFVYRIKTENENEEEFEDDSSDIYDPPPIFVPTNFKVSTVPNRNATRISIPFDVPKSTEANSGAKPPTASIEPPKLTLKSVPRKPSEQPTKIYVPFKSPRPLSLQSSIGVITPKKIVPLTGASSHKKIDTDSPLKKSALSDTVKASSGSSHTPAKSISSLSEKSGPPQKIIPLSEASTKSLQSIISPSNKPVATPKSDSTKTEMSKTVATSSASKKASGKTPELVKRPVGRPRKILPTESAIMSAKLSNSSSVSTPKLSQSKVVPNLTPSVKMSRYDEDPDFDPSSSKAASPVKLGKQSAEAIANRNLASVGKSAGKKGEVESDNSEDELPKMLSKKKVASHSAKPVGRPRKTYVDDFDDSEDYVPPGLSSTGKQSESESEDSEDELPTKKKMASNSGRPLGRPRKAYVNDFDDSEDYEPPGLSSAGKSARKKGDVESDDSEDEMPKKVPKKKAASTSARPIGRPRKIKPGDTPVKTSNSSSTTSRKDESEDSADEERLKSTKKKAPTSSKKRKADSDEEEMKPSMRKKLTANKKSKYDSEDSEDYSDYEPASKKKTLSTPASSKKKVSHPPSASKKSNVEYTPSTPVSILDDTNVRKSSRKSTSVYAGADRIKPSSRDPDLYNSPRR